MTLSRELRRCRRRVVNAIRRTVLFLALPLVLGLDLTEDALTALGTRPSTATRAVQCLAASLFTTWALAISWTLWQSPAAPPPALIAPQQLIVELRYTLTSLLWAAGQRGGMLTLVCFLIGHHICATAICIMVAWPRCCFCWIMLCTCCTWLDDGLDAERE